MNKEQMIDALEESENTAAETTTGDFPELTKKEYDVLIKFPELDDYDEDLELGWYTRDFIKVCGIGKATMKKRLESLADKGFIKYENRDQRWTGGTNKDSYIELSDLGKDWIKAYKAGEIEAPKKKTTERDNSKRKQIEYNGKSQHICAWARELGMNANTLYNRIYKMGWSVEKAFETASTRDKKKDETPAE